MIAGRVWEKCASRFTTASRSIAGKPRFYKGMQSNNVGARLAREGGLSGD